MGASGLEIPVAVNLSMQDLHDATLPVEIERLLTRYALTASLLRLEITESGLMADPARALETLAALSRLGLHIAVDDFGTGYSSLSYLKRLPVDELKIDRSFVHEMVGDEGDRVIVRSTIDLAHNLGLRVVAEGVEDRATFSLLATLGCDEIQGYFVSKPLTADGLLLWLTNEDKLELRLAA
jgi:EAL domain-containing protein (putative c-di-GMP-specific phosphodiesterase class I)